MGLLSNLVSAAVKTALTPLAIVKDAINIVSDEDPDTTKRLLESAADDVEEAADDISDGNLL